METRQLQFRFDVRPRTEEPPKAVLKINVPENCPSRKKAELWLDTETPERRKKPSSNISRCSACGDTVTLLFRNGVKLAWTEESVIIRGFSKTVYWCEECTENGSIEKTDLQSLPGRTKAFAS